MEKQTEYEQEIDLVSLFFAVLHKYRQIFAAAVACAVLFGAVGMFKHVRSQKAAEAASEMVKRSSERQKSRSMKRTWSNTVLLKQRTTKMLRATIIS